MSKALKEKRERRIALLFVLERDHGEALRINRSEIAKVRQRRRIAKGGPVWPRHRTRRMAGK